VGSRAGFAKAVGLAAALAGLVGCRQILGLDVTPDASAGPAVEAGSPADAGYDAGVLGCGLPATAPSCDTCSRANCCNQSTACAADTMFCAPYETCLGACNGDPACRSQCTIDHPVPATNSAPVSALSACLAAHCEKECGLGCGAFAGYFSEPDAAAACQSCIQQNACQHARACGSSAQCDAFWRCFLACPTLDCKQACVAAEDAGLTAFRPLFQDFSGTCSTACGFGSYWACVGHIGYPVASKMVTWTDWVYDVATQMPVADASVSICNNCPCPTPSFPVLAQGQTDPNGFFTLQFPLTLAPSGQAQSLCVQTSAAGYMTTFFYPGFPFSEPSSSIKDSLEPNVSLGLVLFTAANEEQDLVGLGGTYDPSRGMLAAGVFDCLINAADGVTVSVASNDPLIVPVGAIDGGADAGPTALSGGLPGTGHAVFLNVAPGSYVVTARPPGFDKPIDSVTVNVAAGTLTQVGVFPAPH